MASVASVISANLPGLIDTIEVRSRFSPPFTLKVADLLKPGPSNPVVTATKPTIILRGSIGEQVIAPAGVADPHEWKTNLAGVAVAGATLGAAVVMFIYSVGVFRGKRVR